MEVSKKSLEKPRTTITALELKQLLIQLSVNGKIFFRCRLIGDMWLKHHMRVDSVRGDSVVLLDELDNRYYVVKINSIMQFDLDDRFQQYLANFHYQVQASGELEA